MNEQAWLSERFESSRPHLRGVAYRMLGSVAEADDAVQEAWLRLSRTDTSGVENLGGWLTTVVARVCLDMLRSRKSRREDALDAHPSAPPITARDASSDPEHDTLLAGSVGLALLIVLETLPPAERVAYVLHDMFDLPFDEIAPIVGRTPTAARQLASRARRRVQGARAKPGADRARQQEIVTAFLAASRAGNFDALLALLDPNVAMRADRAAVAIGTTDELHGAAAVAGGFSGRARAAQVALLDGVAGLVWAPGGQTRVAFQFTIARGRITAIDLVGDPERLAQLEVEILREPPPSRA